MSNTLSMEELYGFADEDFVYKLQKKYVKYFKKGPILDLGCGRGIFLKILKEQEIEALGVDNSNEVFNYTRSKDLNIYRDDAFVFLKRAIKERQKYEGIFCSHFIEHLTVDQAQIFLSLCFKVLKPKGRLIIITPNPKDLRVITDIFWLDKTHVRPYPLDLLRVLFIKSRYKIKESGVDQDTKLRHFRTNFFDAISKLIFSKTPLGIYLNTGHDIYIVGERSE